MWDRRTGADRGVRAGRGTSSEGGPSKEPVSWYGCLTSITSKFISQKLSANYHKYGAEGPVTPELNKMHGAETVMTGNILAW